MTHLIRIDKGPVMDWTNDSGLDEWYRKWKKGVEVLFKGPLNGCWKESNAIMWRSWNGPSRQVDH